MTATTPSALVTFLNEAARYFERRETHGEDGAFWANAMNADNCRKAAAMIAEQAAETGRLEDLMATMVPLSKDGRFAFIDGPGDVELDHGGELRRRAEAAEVTLAKNTEDLAEAKANLNASRHLVELRTKQRDDEAKRADGNWECIREEQAATSALREELAQLRQDGAEKLAFGRRLRRVRHKKRQSTYRVIGLAPVQISVSGPNHGSRKARTIVEGDKLTIYWADIDDTFHLRFPDEFEDGRFEDIQDPAVASCSP